MDIATTLLEYTADPNAQSKVFCCSLCLHVFLILPSLIKAGFSPLHLAVSSPQLASVIIR